MFDWVQNVWDGLAGWLHSLFQAFMDFMLDLVVLVLDLVLTGIAAIIEAIPAPDFITSGGASTMLSAIDPGILYFLDRSQFDAAMAILGAGFTFRLVRKLVTLGQW